jgi:hypothetical protein
MRTWIEMPPGSVVVEIPPGMTWIPVENVPWNCYGCIGVLQAREEVLHLGENRQYTVPIRFETEGPGWGGATAIRAVAQVDIWGYFLSDSAYLDLTITEDFSRFGFPEGFWEAPRMSEELEPADSPPVTVDPAILEAAGTPPPPPPPPLITAAPATPYEP